jgi:hypothetical protein
MRMHYARSLCPWSANWFNDVPRLTSKIGMQSLPLGSWLLRGRMDNPATLELGLAVD